MMMPNRIERVNIRKDNFREYETITEYHGSEITNY